MPVISVQRFNVSETSANSLFIAVGGSGMAVDIEEFVRNQYIGVWFDQSIFPPAAKLDVKIIALPYGEVARKYGFHVGASLTGLTAADMSGGFEIYADLWDAFMPSLDDIQSSTLLITSNMYFPRTALSLYVTPQQIEQFENMYGQSVDEAYRSAVGRLTAQIGNIFDMGAILDETDETKKDDTIRWILQTYTAHALCSPSMQISAPLQNAYEEARDVLERLKAGMMSLEEPAQRKTGPGNANACVVTFKNKYIG